MKITAPANRNVLVIVFEPSLKAPAPDVEIDRFELAAGQEVEKDYNSASAGYRFETVSKAVQENLTLMQPEERREKMMNEDQERLDTVQRGANFEQIDEEVSAGSEAASKNEELAKRVEIRNADEPVTRKARKAR